MFELFRRLVGTTHSEGHQTVCQVLAIGSHGSMVQYRLLFTVISPFSSKKVRSNHTKIKNSKPHRCFGLMMEFPDVCFQTTTLILLVCYCKTKSKRLLGKRFKACFDTMFYGLPTQLLNQRVMSLGCSFKSYTSIK